MKDCMYSSWNCRHPPSNNVIGACCGLHVKHRGTAAMTCDLLFCTGAEQPLADIPSQEVMLDAGETEADVQGDDDSMLSSEGEPVEGAHLMLPYMDAPCDIDTSNVSQVELLVDIMFLSSSPQGGAEGDVHSAHDR